MKQNSMNKMLSLVLVFVLLAAAALTGCSGAPTESTAPTETTAPIGTITVLGEGSKAFNLSIVDKDGAEHLYEIHTDEEFVGFALIAHELIEGEEGPYGMYIKSVLGQVLDYETDRMYWAFYIEGEYAMTGVDLTPVIEGGSYMLKAESAEEA